ncbi:MAG: phosphoribosylaminoimidazolesuccinocarboxamide synthase [Candidatus Helarchaeota archaeon]|nr:phosphoribosylaminoimidazolesuccinocarboxamide synthase [Candidatus Helarchaeota archaeon]
MGSVKDLQVLKKPSEKEAGIGRFVFSDRYSVFDWGEMPDHILNKGAALCLMGAYGFEKAEEQGIKTHYRGLVRSDGKLVRLDELDEPTNIMEISLVRVIHPKFENDNYEYSMFTPELTNFLIPLEIIYRNGLPLGSSIFKRLEKGKVKFQDLCLEHYPKPGEKLGTPIFDVSTKLEESDRYITWKEAQKIAGLNDEEIEEIKEVLFKVNNLITKIVQKAKLVNEDGKIELAYNSYRELMLVDVICTLDECRFTSKGMHISKEIARQFYKKTNWYEDVEEAKKVAEESKTKEWKNLCKSQPSKLPFELKKIIPDVYTSATNAFLDRKFFNSPKLENIIKKYKEFVKKEKIP